MCDINKEIRVKRYLELRSLGHSRGWAQRARDFTDKRFEEAKTRNVEEIIFHRRKI